MKSKLYILFLTFFLLAKGYAQKIELGVSFNDTTLNPSKLIKYSPSFERINLKLELSNILNQLYSESYLTATTDSIIIDSSYYKAYLHLGKKYNWTSLKNKNISEEILSKIGFRDKLYNNRPFNQRQLSIFFNKIISFYEENGYPFASIQLDSLDINENKISAQLNLTKGTFYKVDSVLIKGDAGISSQYIQNYIRIKEGDIYNEVFIKKISTRIKELPFVTETDPFKILFTESKTKIYLNLKKRKASRFNGVLGILPNDNTGKIRLTGDVKLNLLNSFHKGEQIDFNWRSLQQNTQDLKLFINYPFVLNSPFGVDYNFKLYKKDTFFIDVENKIGMRYILKGNNYFKLFYSTKSSNLLSQTGLANLSVLPPYADISSNLYGIGLYNSKLDYRLNPRKGYTISINGSLGNKTIRKNPKINDQLYAEINLNTILYNSEFNFDFYIPIKKRSVIKLGSQNSLIFNESLFENELLRIGGLKTLRGFDEESIFASFYSIETFEYRFILEQNSYLYLFFDGAYYENNSINNYISDFPFSFGSGISFETKAGIFSVSYAVGRQFNNPILFRSAKIHFGFVNYF